MRCRLTASLHSTQPEIRAAAVLAVAELLARPSALATLAGSSTLLGALTEWMTLVGGALLDGVPLVVTAGHTAGNFHWHHLDCCWACPVSIWSNAPASIPSRCVRFNCCLASGRSSGSANHRAALLQSSTPSFLGAVQLLLGRTATGAGGSSEVLATKLANTLCSRAIKTLPAILQEVRALAPLEQVRAVDSPCS